MNTLITRAVRRRTLFAWTSFAEYKNSSAETPRSSIRVRCLPRTRHWSSKGYKTGCSRCWACSYLIPHYCHSDSGARLRRDLTNLGGQRKQLNHSESSVRSWGRGRVAVLEVQHVLTLSRVVRASQWGTSRLIQAKFEVQRASNDAKNM